MIVDSQRGYVLTANHVVANATAVQIRTKDGRKFAGRVVGRDAPTDIALLQIREPAGLKAIAFGDSDALQVGDFGEDVEVAIDAHWPKPYHDHRIGPRRTGRTPGAGEVAIM